MAGARHITIGGHYLYVIADQGLIIVNVDEPLVSAIVPLDNGRASALQFRYLFVTDRTGLRVVDITNPAEPKLLASARVTIHEAERVYVARTYAYVAARSQGLAVVDIWNPAAPKLIEFFDANGQLRDTRDVVIGSTNASLFAYVADGEAGLKIVQLTSPDSQPNFYGFSPLPRPQGLAPT